jgi:RNA polymerase sigma-70 factor, ECF subfamily
MTRIQDDRAAPSDHGVRFEQLAREQLPWLYPMARRLTGAQADDVVQECLMRAYRGFDTLRAAEAAPAWFRTILVNCAHDVYRHDGRRVRETSLDELDDHHLRRRILDGDREPDLDGIGRDVVGSLVDDDVWSVLDRLPQRYRLALVLVHMEGLPTAHVSRILGVPRNTLLSWLHRGRKLFARALNEHAAETDDERGAIVGIGAAS